MDALQNMVKKASEQIEYYILMFYDLPVLKFSFKKGNIDIINESLVPFDLYVENGLDIDTQVSNRVNIEHWLSNRLLVVNRKFGKEIMNFLNITQSNNERARAGVSLLYHALSTSDNYWVKRESEDIDYSSINIWDNHLDNSFIELSLTGKGYSLDSDRIDPVLDITTNGLMAKGWIRENSLLYLLKAGSQDEIEREVSASKILQSIGIECVDYNRFTFKDVNCVKSKCYTGYNVNSCDAEDYECNFNISDIVNKYEDSYNKLIVGNFIIANSDLHNHNWGILFDADKKVSGLTKPYDFNHAFEASELTLCNPDMIVYKSRNTFKESAVTAYRKLVSKGFKLKELDYDCKYSDFARSRISLLNSCL